MQPDSYKLISEIIVPWKLGLGHFLASTQRFKELISNHIYLEVRANTKKQKIKEKSLKIRTQKQIIIP